MRDTRSGIAELMDDQSSDERMLYRTLTQFETVNLLFSGRNRLLSELLSFLAKEKGLKAATLMDLGAGGGDWTAKCLELCTRNGLRVHIRCVDHDPRMVRFLEARFSGEKSVEVVQADVSDQGLWREKVDFLFGNHLLHHLPDSSIVELLRSCAAQAKYGFFFNDLKRSRLSFLCFGAVAAIFFRNSFIRKDGLTSITKGFTRKELLSFAEGAGLSPELRIRSAGLGHLCLWKFAQHGPCGVPEAPGKSEKC